MIQYLTGVSNEEYHYGELFSKYISSSGLKKYFDCPLEYLRYKNNPKKETEAMKLGTLWHDMLAANHPDGESLDKYKVLQYKVNQSTGKPYGATTKEQLEFIAQQKIENPNKTFVDQADWEKAKFMVKMIFEELYPNQHRRLFHKLFEAGSPEVVFTAEDFGPNVHIKTRHDHDGPSYIIDYKTTRRPINDFFYDIKEYGYDISLGMYRAMKKAFLIEQGYTSEEAEKNLYWYWLVQNTDTYDWALIDGVDFFEIGDRKFWHCINLHSDCLQKNEWPGVSMYSSGYALRLNVPPYFDKFNNFL